MPIRPPAGAAVRPLIDALGGVDELQRESAVARLAVIGARTVEPLLHEYAAAAPRLQSGILRALEAVADPKALPIARGAAHSEHPEVAVAAVRVLRALLTSPGPGRARAAGAGRTAARGMARGARRGPPGARRAEQPAGALRPARQPARSRPPPRRLPRGPRGDRRRDVPRDAGRRVRSVLAQRRCLVARARGRRLPRDRPPRGADTPSCGGQADHGPLARGHRGSDGSHLKPKVLKF